MLRVEILRPGHENGTFRGAGQGPDPAAPGNLQPGRDMKLQAARNDPHGRRLTLHLRINSLSETKGRRMSDKTLTRMDLAEAVFREVGLSRHESAQLVESVLGHISDALVRGEQVKISSFGTFSVRDKNERIGRNPKTGEEVPITPRRVLSFRPSHLMKERIAAGNR